MQYETSGTPVAGIGSSVSFWVEGAGRIVSAGDVAGLLTDVTNGAEAGALAFFTKGPSQSQFVAAERMRLDSSGNLGIGTTNPSNKLHVDSGATALNSVFEADGNTLIQVKSDAANSVVRLQLKNDAETWDIRNDGAIGDSLIFRRVGVGSKFFFTTDGELGIGAVSPAFPLEVRGNGSDNVTIWAEGNISAGGYITRTSVFDKSKSVWDYIRDSDYYLTNGKIDHTKFYGYTTYSATDYSRPEWVDTSYFDFDEETNQSVYVEEGENIYPYKIIEEGVLLDAEVELLRQAIFELKQENELMKQSLCSLGIASLC